MFSPYEGDPVFQYLVKAVTYLCEKEGRKIEQADSPAKKVVGFYGESVLGAIDYDPYFSVPIYEIEKSQFLADFPAFKDLFLTSAGRLKMGELLSSFKDSYLEDEDLNLFPAFAKIFGEVDGSNFIEKYEDYKMRSSKSFKEYEEHKKNFRRITLEP